MNWRQFEEDDIYWRKIVELLQDRRALIDAELRDPGKTVDIITLRMLQQERKDIEYILSIPSIFIDFPDNEEVSHGDLGKNSN